MDKQIETYLQSLLSDRKRLLKGALKGLSKTKKDSSNIEADFILKQEIEWELGMIYKSQKSMDYFEEEC